MAVATATPGAGSTAGGAVAQPGGGMLGTDGTLYVGGADSQPQTQPSQLAGSTVTTPKGPVGPDGKPITQATADYFNQLAAIAGPEQAPGVDMSGYINAFNNSYSQQMASIKAGLTQSLGELQGRRDQAAGIVAKMPAQVNSNYGDVTANDAQMRQTDTQGLSGEALGQAAGANARNSAVLQENKAAAKDTGAYMKLGITANTQSGEAALNASANSAEANAAAARTAAEEQMYLQQASQAAGYANARQDRISHFTESQIAAGAAPSGIPGVTVSQLNQIQSNPTFSKTSTTMGSLVSEPTAHSAEEFQVTLNHIAQLPANIQAVLRATNPDFFKMAPTWAAGKGAGEKSVNNLNGATSGNPSLPQQLNSDFTQAGQAIGSGPEFAPARWLGGWTANW